MPISKK